MFFSRETNRQAELITNRHPRIRRAMLVSATLHRGFIHRMSTFIFLGTTATQQAVGREHVQFSPSAPVSLDELLRNVDQWSDLIGDDDSSGSSSIHQAPPAAPVRAPAPDDRLDSAGTARRAAAVTQPGLGPNVPLLDQTSVALDQVRRAEIPRPYEYKPSAALEQETISTLRTTASAMSSSIEDEQEAAVQLDQIYRSDTPQSVQYKIPGDIQPSTGSLLRMAPAFGQEDTAPEAAFTTSQLRQPQAQASRQQATSVSRPSLTMGTPIFDETAIQLDQIQRSNAAQSVQYKAPAGIQPSAGSILKSTSALGQDESPHETPVNITQFSRSTAMTMPASDAVQQQQQQVSSVTRVSAATDMPILDEAAVYLGQVHRTEAPQTVQYKASSDIQPVAGSILVSTSALGEEQTAYETPLNVSQLRQAVARELPTEPKRYASQVWQPSITAEVSQLDEASVPIDVIQRAQASQPFKYEKPADLQQQSATLHSSPSAMASDVEHGDMGFTSAQSYQQPRGHKAKRPSAVSDLSYGPPEDELDELPQALQVQQQRLQRMPLKLHDQPKLILNRQSVIETDDQAQSTAVGQVRRMVPAVRKPKEKQEEEEEEELIEESSTNIEVLESEETLETEMPEPTLVAEKIEEPLEIQSTQIIDTIEIPPATNETDEHKPEAIIVTAEAEPSEDVSRVTETITEQMEELVQESLPIPDQPDLLPLATMPDETITSEQQRVPDRDVQEVLATSLEPTHVSHAESSATSVTQVSQLTQQLVSPSKEQDEFFDVDSDVVDLPATHAEASPISLAEAEKLQREAVVKQKPEEFQEPALASVGETKPAPEEKQKRVSVEVPKSQIVDEQKPKQEEKQKRISVEVPQPQSVQEQTVAPQDKQKRVSVGEPKPAPEERQKRVSVEVPQPQAVPEEKQKRISVEVPKQQQQQTVVEEKQKRVSVEEPKPAAQEKQKRISVEVPQAQAIQEQKPQPVQEQQLATEQKQKRISVEESKSRIVEEQAPKQEEKQKRVSVGEPKPQTVQEQRPVPEERTKRISVEVPKPQAVPEEKQKRISVEVPKPQSAQEQQPLLSQEQKPVAEERQKRISVEVPKAQPVQEQKPQSEEKQKRISVEVPKPQPAQEQQQPLLQSKRPCLKRNRSEYPFRN